MCGPLYYQFQQCGHALPTGQTERCQNAYQTNSVCPNVGNQIPVAHQQPGLCSSCQQGQPQAQHIEESEDDSDDDSDDDEEEHSTEESDNEDAHTVRPGHDTRSRASGHSKARSDARSRNTAISQDNRSETSDQRASRLSNIYSMPVNHGATQGTPGQPNGYTLPQQAPSAADINRNMPGMTHPQQYAMPSQAHIPKQQFNAAPGPSSSQHQHYPVPQGYATQPQQQQYPPQPGYPAPPQQQQYGMPSVQQQVVQPPIQHSAPQHYQPPQAESVADSDARSANPPYVHPNQHNSIGGGRIGRQRPHDMESTISRTDTIIERKAAEKRAREREAAEMPSSSRSGQAGNRRVRGQGSTNQPLPPPRPSEHPRRFDHDRDIRRARRKAERAEEKLFEQDTQRAIAQSRPWEKELEEDEQVRKAMLASLEDYAAGIEHRVGKSHPVMVTYTQCGHDVMRESTDFDTGSNTPSIVHKDGLCDHCYLQAQNQGASTVYAPTSIASHQPPSAQAQALRAFQQPQYQPYVQPQAPQAFNQHNSPQQASRSSAPSGVPSINVQSPPGSDGVLHQPHAVPLDSGRPVSRHGSSRRGYSKTEPATEPSSRASSLHPNDAMHRSARTTADPSIAGSSQASDATTADRRDRKSRASNSLHSTGRRSAAKDERADDNTIASAPASVITVLDQEDRLQASASHRRGGHSRHDRPPSSAEGSYTEEASSIASTSRTKESTRSKHSRKQAQGPGLRVVNEYYEPTITPTMIWTTGAPKLDRPIFASRAHSQVDLAAIPEIPETEPSIAGTEAPSIDETYRNRAKEEARRNYLFEQHVRECDAETKINPDVLNQTWRGPNETHAGSGQS